MKINRSLLRDALDVALSMEAEEAKAESAQTEVEFEKTWYGRLMDRTQLDGASKVEQQVQWNVRVNTPETMCYGGSVRVRAIDGERFVLCIKNYEKGKQGCLEHEFEVSRDAFEQIRRIAEKGMIKTRYTFPIEGTEYAWEIDVFADADGNPYEWVKVDLEIDDPGFVIPPMPVALEGCFMDTPTSRTPEQEKLIDALMSKYFTVGNPFQTTK